MATLQERLADSLKELQRLQNENGLAVIKSSDLSRTHLERLVTNGFIQEVMKGINKINSCQILIGFTKQIVYDYFVLNNAGIAVLFYPKSSNHQ